MASDFLNKRAAQSAARIDDKYGFGAYGGSEWLDNGGRTEKLAAIKSSDLAYHGEDKSSLWSRMWNAIKSGGKSVAADMMETGAQWAPTGGETSMGQFAGLGQLGQAVRRAKENGTTIEEEDKALTELRSQKQKEHQQKMFEASERLSASAASDLAKAKKGASKLGSFALDAVSQVPQLAGDAVLNFAAPGLGMASLGLRSFGGSAREAREAGLSDDEVLGMKGVKTFAKGASGAAIEMFSEGLFDAFGGKIYGKGLADAGVEDAIKSMTTNEAKRWALAMAKNMAGEGAEEAVSDILNLGVSAMLGLKDQQGNLLDGYDSFGDAVKNILYDFAIGGVLGGVGGGVNTALRTRSAVRTNKIAAQTYSDTEKSAALLNRATELDVVGQAGKVNKNVTKAMDTLKANTEAGKTTDGATLRAVAEAVAKAEVEAKAAANTELAQQQLVTNFHLSEAKANEMAKAIGYYATQSQLSQSSDVFLQAAAQYAIDENVSYYEETLLRESPAALSVINMANGVMPDTATMEQLRTQEGNEALSQSATASLRQRLKEKGAGKSSGQRMAEGLQLAAQETLQNRLANGVVHEYTDGTRTLELTGQNGQAIEVTRDVFIRAAKEQGFADSEKALGKMFDALTNKAETIKEDTPYEGRADQEQRAAGRGDGRGDGRSARGRVAVRDDGLSGAASERSGESGGHVSEATGGAEGQVRGQDVAGDGRSDGKKQRAVEGAGREVSRQSRKARTDKGRAEVNRAAVKTVYEEHPDAFLQQEIRPGVSVYTLKAKGVRYMGEKLAGELRFLKARNATVTRGGAAPELRFIKDMFPLVSGKEANGAQRGNEIFVSLTGTRSATETYEHELGHAIFKRDTALRDELLSSAEESLASDKALFTEFKRAYEPYIKMYGQDTKSQKHVMERVYEELLCDLNAGVNRGNWCSDEDFKAMSAAVQSSLNSWINEGADERAMLNAGYSMEEQLDNLQDALDEYKDALKNGDREERDEAKSYLNDLSLAMPHSPETLKVIGMRDLNFGLRAGHALIGHGMDLTPETLGRVMEEFDDNVLFITQGDATGKEQEKQLAAADYESAMRQRNLSMPQKDAIARRRLARERSAEQLVEVYVKDPTANRVLKLPLYPSYPASEGVNYNRTDGLPRLDNFIKTAFVVGDPAYFAQKAIDGKSLVYYNAANLATGGYGALASKMEETYNKSGKAIYRVRDAREYAMLPEEYEVLPKKDKEAIQGISDPLDHLTDLMDAYNAAYDHPVEGAQDVEAYYLLTHVFPSIEVAKFAIISAYEKQGVSEVVSTGDNWLDVMNSSTGEISSLSIAPAEGVAALMDSSTKVEGWKIYLDFGELPIVSTKLYTPEAEKSTAPEGDINDIIDTVDDDFVVEDDDLDEIIKLGEGVVKAIDEAMAEETKPTTEPTTHADVDPQTYQIKSQPVNLFSLPTLREKNAARASDGHVLTVGQAEYFANSYARDADGRLLTMYHGTNTYGFTVFNGKPIFLADLGNASLTYFHYTPDTEKMAEEKAREKVGNLPRGDDVMEAAVNDELLEMYKTAPDRIAGIEKAVSDLRARTGQPGRTRWGAAPPAHGMYSLYANATNPVIIDCDGRAWNHLPHRRVQQEGGLLRGKDFTWEGTQTDDIVAKAFEDGYDSVIFRNIRDYMSDNVNTKRPPFTVIVCKDSNQVKSTNNLVPTDDPDILYMLPEDADPREYSSSNRPLTAAQMATFADSQLRDEMGRLKNMYVGRQSFGYEWFDPSKQADKRSLFMTDNPFVASSYSGWPRSVSRLRDLVHSIDRDTDLSALSQPIEDDIFGGWDGDVEGAFHDAIFASSEEDDGAQERKLAATYYLLQKGFKVKETALTTEDAAARLESAMDKWGKKIKTLTKDVVTEDKALLDVFEDFGLTDALEMFEEAETREEKAEAIRGAADAFISVANDIDSFEEDTTNVSDRLAKKVFRYADQLAAAADQFYEGLFEGDDLVPDGRTFLRALPADEQADFMGVDTFGDTKFYELKSPDDTFGTRLVSEDELVYQAIKLEMSLQDMVFGFGKSRPGIYEVYGNLKNPLILNEGGTPVMWNGMPLNLLPENMQSLGRQIMAQRGHTLLSTRDTSEIAERGGCDGVIIYNCMDVGEYKTHGVTNYTPSTIAVAFRPEQIKSTSNLAPTRDKRIAYMLPEDYAGEFADLTPVVELGRALLKAENSSVDAAMLPANIGSIADISPDAMGRVILRRRFDNLGSARAGFDPYSAAQIKYGSMESRPGTYRYANAPKSVDGQKPVTQSVVTVASSEATPESRLKDIEDAVLDGKLSHEVKTDRAAMAKAKESLSRDGWSAAYAKWVEQVRSGKHDKATVAMGALLLDVAGNNDRASGNLYIDILQDYAAVLTRAGQILQAGKLIQQLTPMGKLYGIERSVERMNEEIIARAEKAGVETEGIQIDPILLVEYRDAQTDAERQAALEKIYQNIADQIPATAMDKFTAWRYTAMLGNFRTQIRNVVGNFGFQPIRIMKETTAGLMEALVNTVSGGKLERTTSAFYDRATFKKAKEMFDQDADIIMSGGKYNDRSSRDPFNQEVERRRRIFKTKALEAWRKGTNWAMDKGDLVFCSFTYADSLARFMKANNTTWDEASPELQERARLKAIKDAAEATYRDSNAFADAFARLLRQQNTEGNPVKKALNLIGEGILPFRKTPANILLRSLEYSPLNILGVAVKMAQYNLAKAQLINEPGKLGQQVNKAISAAKEADVTGADIVSALAQTLTGSALVLLGFSLASMGHLVGKAPDDDKEKEFWELMGHQEYSLEYNGHSYTLDWLAPESIPLYLGANLHAAALSKGLTLKEALEAVGSITDPMLQMSMLQGVNDALENASTYGDESALPRFVENAMWSYLTQFVPTLVGQANRSINNQRMSTYVDKNKDVPDFWQKLSGKITGKIPGLNNITGAQIAYLDAWGRTEKNADTATENVLYQLFSPGYASTIEETAMEKELQRLYEATGKKSVLISRADKYFNVGGERVDLTGAQYLTYSQTRGQTAFRLMSNLTSSAEYRGMTDDQKTEAVESVYRYANEVAKEMTLRDYEITESWVLKAREAANDHDFPVSDYVNLYASGINSVRGIADANGDTITNTASMRKAQMIYQMYPDLTPEQYNVLFDDFNVGKTVRGWAPALIDRKLAALGG